MTTDTYVNGARAELLTTLDAWLALDDRPIVEVPVPEFGRTVLMRAMSAADRDEWELRFIADQHVEPDPEKARERDRQMTYRERLAGAKAQIVARCVVNERGERIFSDQDVALLQQRNAAAINRLADRANELCGFTQADQAALLKASGGTASDEQPSA